MAPLSTARRKNLPASKFAVPASESKTGKPAYPVDTKGRAKAALARVAANGTPKEKAKVKVKVKRAFPKMNVK